MRPLTAPVPLFARFFGRLSFLAPLVLRLAVGLVMVAHGLGKLQAGPTEAWGGFFALAKLRQEGAVP